MKGQAAADFITTYGFAFLLVTLATVSFVSLDINMGGETPLRCEFPEPWTCDASSMQVDLENNTVSMRVTYNGADLQQLSTLEFVSRNGKWNVEKAKTINLSSDIRTTNGAFGTAEVIHDIHFHDGHFYVLGFVGDPNTGEYGNIIHRYDEDWTNHTQVWSRLEANWANAVGELAFYDGKWYMLDGRRKVWVFNEDFSVNTTESLSSPETQWADHGMEYYDGNFYVVDLVEATEGHPSTWTTLPDNDIDVYNEEFEYVGSRPIANGEMPYEIWARGLDYNGGYWYVGETIDRDEDAVRVFVHDQAWNHTATIRLEGMDSNNAKAFTAHDNNWYYGDLTVVRVYPSPVNTFNEVFNPGQTHTLQVRLDGAVSGEIVEDQTYTFPVQLTEFPVKRGSGFEQKKTGSFTIQT